MAFGVVLIDSFVFHYNLGSMGFWEVVAEVYRDAKVILGYFVLAFTIAGVLMLMAYWALAWVEGVDIDAGRADIFADPIDPETEEDPEGFDGVETKGENFIRYEGRVKANPESPKKNSIDLEIS